MDYHDQLEFALDNCGDFYHAVITHSGRLKAVIDRTYGLEEAPAAYRYIETGHKKGNIVLTI
ncbi:MAG: zinc-binding dehydrogenase [Dehalococcoidia bacterium]